jgi:tRNA A37 threonylcarbamoyltransferase TsaD
LGEKWNGLMLQYWPEILTEISSDAAVGDVMDKFADRRLAAQVTNKVEYDAFRAWVNGNNLYQPNVVESTRTWLSYALGTDALIGKEITSNDVRIVAFETANADSGAMGLSRPTSFAFEVAIDGVNIGGGMVAVEILKENLAKVLDVEGATTLSPDAFSSDNVEISFDTPVDGKARFTVTPPNDTGNSFFMRVKVK